MQVQGKVYLKNLKEQLLLHPMFDDAFIKKNIQFATF